MENLNKENFWNEMDARYPAAMHVFKGWIDMYKKEVKWDELFGEDLLEPVKFHDLPYEMQIGIILRFISEIFKDKGTNYLGPDQTKGMISKALDDLNHVIKLRMTIPNDPDVMRKIKDN